YSPLYIFENPFLNLNAYVSAKPSAPSSSFLITERWPQPPYPVVDSLMTSSWPKTMLSTVFPCIFSISILAATVPILYIGWATVVSAGFVILEKSILSKPTTATSSGTWSPAALISFNAPIANKSDTAKTAVGRSCNRSEERRVGKECRSRWWRRYERGTVDLIQEWLYTVDQHVLSVQ